ncbi:MAG: hypothetical protein ABSF35_22175 [Polyangia bacterium]
MGSGPSGGLQLGKPAVWDIRLWRSAWSMCGSMPVMKTVEYEMGVVTFIDVLGFRVLVKNRPPSEIKRIQELFLWFGKPRHLADDDEFDPKHSIRVISFSDSIVRFLPAEALSAVFQETCNLLHAQGELVNQGVLIRGGMTCGKVLFDNEGAFGPGFIEAYDIEKDFAIYPRIAVSPGLLKAVLEGSPEFVCEHEPQSEAGWIRKMLQRGDDGVWFIDYLGAFRDELNDPATYPNYLRSHRDIILKLADQLETHGPALSSLALKANWLARYHNRTVARVKDWLLEQGVTLDDVLFPVSRLPAMCELPAPPSF